MQMIRKLASDFTGLWRICGPAVALRWLLQVSIHVPTILRSRSLMVADNKMGHGPFTVQLRRYGARFRIQGPNAFSGIREMYVRDQYLSDGWLAIPPDALVVDLGANMGNFTNLALATHPTVHVVSVEPSAALNAAFENSLSLNPDHRQRAKLIRAFIGTPTKKIIDVIATEPAYSGAPWISEDELLGQLKGRPVDFLKCDIEGGEFGILTDSSKLLQRTRQIACELHSFAGDVQSIVNTLTRLGFTLRTTVLEHDGSCVVVGKRPATYSTPSTT